MWDFLDLLIRLNSMDADPIWRLESRSSRPLMARLLLPHAQLVNASASLMVTGVCERSNRCHLGDLFACIPGNQSNGLSYIDDAIKSGARAFLLDRPLPQLPYPQLITPNVRGDFSRLCHALSGFPSHELTTAGITGTNGKTSATWLLQAIWRSVDIRSGLMGTIHHETGAISPHESNLTTPTSAHLANLLRETHENHATHTALELSSHALDQQRCAGLMLNVAAITNVTRDHLDYHATFEQYLDAKARIASHIKSGGTLWLNESSATYHLLRDALEGHQFDPIRLRTFGMTAHADLSASEIRSTKTGSRFIVTHQRQSVETTLHLAGHHNVENALTAIACALSTGISLKDACHGVSTLAHVPGRLQRVDAGQPFDVFVDYAHTPDGLTRVLQSLRSQTTGRLIVVFGAGGNRDIAKRPLMGHAVAKFADVMVLTSDNPRNEEPMSIIHQIFAGIPNTATGNVAIEADRHNAIAYAISKAEPGDTVLIAGKGHETTQTIGAQVIPFDDARVIHSLLSAPSILPLDRPAHDTHPWRKTG